MNNTALRSTTWQAMVEFARAVKPGEKVRLRACHGCERPLTALIDESERA